MEGEKINIVLGPVYFEVPMLFGVLETKRERKKAVGIAKVEALGARGWCCPCARGFCKSKVQGKGASVTSHKLYHVVQFGRSELPAPPAMASALHDLRPFRTERRCRLSTEGAAKWSDAANKAQQAARLGTPGSRREWRVRGGADGGTKSRPDAMDGPCSAAYS